jgi:hypothetical protein
VEVLHDDFPEETGWTLRDSAGALIARQLTDSYNISGGTTAETRNIAAGMYTFVMTDRAGDGICCEFGFGSFRILVDGETVISNNGEFSESVQETFTFPVGSSNLDDEVGYNCSGVLSGCSMVRHFQRKPTCPLAYYLLYTGYRYHDRGNVLLSSNFSSHSLINSFCHESRLLWKSFMMTIPWKQAGRSATAPVR